MSKRSLNRRLAAAQDRTLRYLAYIRVSAVKGRSGEDFHSPEIQLAAIRRKTRGMVEVAVIDCDIDVPGTTFAREGIDQVMKLARAGAFDVLAVYNIKRFGRNTLEGLQTLNELADLGVTIISAKEHIETFTPAGRKHLTDLLSGAQMQSEEIGDVWSDVIEQRAHTGKHHGNRLSGYTSIDGQLVKHAVVGSAIEEAFKRYARGDSTAEICRYVAAARGKPVAARQLKRWLANPAYLGRVVLRGVEMPGAHKPLVDEETWMRVQGRIAKASTEPPHNRNPAWSLVGLLFCEGGCAVFRHPYRNKKTGEREFRVICTRVAKRTGGECVGMGTPLLAPMEAEVLAQAHAYIEHLKRDVGARAAALSRRAVARIDADHLRRQIKESRDAIAKLTTAWAKSTVGDREYQTSVAELREAEGLASAQLQEVGGEDVAGDPFEAMNSAEALLALWPEMVALERNRALGKIVKRAVVRRAAYHREPAADRVRVTDWMF